MGWRVGRIVGSLVAIREFVLQSRESENRLPHQRHGIDDICLREEL